MTPTKGPNVRSLDTQSCPSPRQCDPRTERTRTAVIEAATELLMTDGPSAVTHANVAHAANISRTTAYKHCPTRADLLRATIEAIHKTTPRVDGLSGEIRADLQLFFSEIIMDLQDDQRAPLMAIMMERALHDPTVAAVRNDLTAEFEPVFNSIIKSAREAGQLRADTDASLALASIVGSLLFFKFMSADRFDDAVAARVLDEWVATHRPD